MGNDGLIVIIIDSVVHGSDGDVLKFVPVAARTDRKRQGSRFDRYVVGIFAGNGNNDVCAGLRTQLDGIDGGLAVLSSRHPPLREYGDPGRVIVRRSRGYAGDGQASSILGVPVVTAWVMVVSLSSSST